MILRRVAHHQVREFYEEYYHTGAYRHQRLGEAFLGHFYPHVTDHELFYEEDNSKAACLIDRNYTVQAQAA